MEGVRIRLTIKPPHSDLQKREGGEMGTSKGRGGGEENVSQQAQYPSFL